MREIKLRAWYRGKMYRFVEHHTHPDGSSGVNDMGESIERMFSPGDEVELMQWTGLKDKNDKDIYEGDILTYEYRFYGQDFTDEPFVVEFGTQEFADSNYQAFCQGYNLDPTVTEQYRVIGNIYENPELKPVQH